MSRRRPFDFCKRGLRSSFVALSVAFLGLFAGVATAKPENAEGIRFFEAKIRPVLIKKCYSCHSQQAAKSKKLKGKLLLDSRAGVIAGGESGPAIVPGKPEESLLLAALRHDSLEMPPNQKLSDSTIGDFAKWIEMGAPDPREGTKVDLRAIDSQAGRDHWAYRPLRQVPLPAVDDETWLRTTPDRFVLAKLEQKEMSPSEPADKWTMIRRAYFDLIGLPPSPKDVREFVTRDSQDAYTDMIDRLLKSKHYGERWGRHWLDVARFGETDGSDVHENKFRPDAWRYRDAVINAFNDDLPWNEFVTQQISGRRLSGEELSTELARFPELGTTLKKSDNPNDKMFHKLDDMVSETGSAFLGLTIGCARCHDHKIDPITAEEYYRLTAVFFDQVKVEPRASKKTIPLEVNEPHLLAAGSWKRPIKKVTPGFVEVLMRPTVRSENWLLDEQTSDVIDPRFGLALWMTDVDQGAGALLARVVVNRVWQHHFGRGLVDTPNDFGRLGGKPSHPELLEWLANELIRNGWRLKPLHRLIMTSSAYRQSASDRWINVDRENRFVWQYRPRRLEAEIIRDNFLSASGVLNKQMFGKSIGIGSVRTDEAGREKPEAWRRSIYLLTPRFNTHPALKVFDAVDNFQSTGARSVSTTPSGALFMYNSPFLWQQAELMAERVKKEAGARAESQVEFVYEVAFGRPPTVRERNLGVEFLADDEANADGNDRTPLVHYCHVIMGLNEFIYVR